MSNAAFSTYNGLVASMTDWLNRVGSARIADRCGDFIALFEAGANKTLRVREMLVRSTAQLTSGYIKLPADFQEAKNVQINLAIPRRLEPVSLSGADDIRTRASATGFSDPDPVGYAFNGNYLEVVPYTTAPLEIEMTYYGKITPLQSDTQTNPIVAAYPELYLYGSLVHSAPYLRDDERVAIWGQAFSEAMTTANNAAQKAEMSGGPLRSRARLRN